MAVKSGIEISECWDLQQVLKNVWFHSGWPYTASFCCCCCCSRVCSVYLGASENVIIRTSAVYRQLIEFMAPHVTENDAWTLCTREEDRVLYRDDENISIKKFPIEKIWSRRPSGHLFFGHLRIFLFLPNNSDSLTAWQDLSAQCSCFDGCINLHFMAKNDQNDREWWERTGCYSNRWCAAGKVLDKSNVKFLPVLTESHFH